MRQPSLLLKVGAFATVVGAGSLAGYGPGAARIAFRPGIGALSTYRVTVTTHSVLEVAGQAPRTLDATTAVQAEQTVLATGPGGSTVQVVLVADGGGQRTVVVRLDRASQLVAIDQAAGPEAGSLADLGPSDVFPAAAGAPPNRPLRPGDRWTVDATLQLPDSAPSHLSGQGRLDRFGLVSGVRAATIVTESTLPVKRRTQSSTGRQSVLEGTQRTSTTASHAVSDGSIVLARSTTEAVYALELLPPAGLVGDPVRGRLLLTVSSTTTRI